MKRPLVPGYLAAVLLLLVVAVPSPGQEFRELDADRDAFTPTTHTVEQGRGLIETAYTFIENRDGPATQSSPENAGG
jgi:hypothetical protein